MSDRVEKHTEMVPCRVCREPIRHGAKKCIHCDSMLDWHRWLGISQTTLALLVALVSVLAASGPRVAELFTPGRSDLNLYVRQVVQRFLELAGANTGNRNSQMLSAQISATTHDGTIVGPMGLELNTVPMVAPGQQVVLELSIHLTRIPDFLAWPHKDIKSATVIVTVVEFRKKPEARRIDVPVDYFQMFCRATEDFDATTRPRSNPSADSRLASRCLGAPPNPM